MPFTGSEILEVASGDPSIGCVVNDRWVVSIDAGRASPSGVLPLTGTFSVMDATTGQALVYTGLPTGATTVYGRCVAEGSYAWFVSGTNLYRIDPSTGTVTTIAAGATGLCVAALPGKIYVIPSSAVFRIYNIGAGTWSNGVSSSGTSTATAAVGVPPNMIVVANSGSTTFRIFDDTGTLLASPGGTGTGAKGAGDFIGSKAYFPNIGSSFINVIDPYAVTATTLSTAGANSCGRNLIAGYDGWLYTFDSALDDICAVSPVTGATDSTSAPTSRTRRYTIYSANSELWIPSGDPL